MTRARKIVGRITFVGSGPGDPGLLTTHAADAIRGAELVVTDADVPQAITALATGEVRTAETTPAETAKVLLAEARAGRSVLRLVPGVGLAAGTAAYAGVPLGPLHTSADLGDVSAADFDALAHAAGTLVLTVEAADAQYVGEQL
ncbi:MAG TPA: SAM-dependent methyltransferase, partial [Dermatophilaceae bacterium]|nr:SAM-dependent methyltransferase [Dermatophilaceae bacterium]